MKKYYNCKKDATNYRIEINEYPTLYKYRSINEFTVDALLKAKLYASSPLVFNDPYDASFVYAEKAIKKFIAEEIVKSKLHQHCGYFNVSNAKQLTEVIFNDLLKSLNFHYQKRFAVSCFTRTNTSEIMWAHYANSAKGFVLEYDGKELNVLAEHLKNQATEKEKSENYPYYSIANFTALAPVVYSNHKRNVDSIFCDLAKLYITDINEIINNKENIENLAFQMRFYLYEYNQFSEALLDSLYYLKKSEWKYEKEWRIVAHNDFCYEDNFKPYVELGTIKPKAIYLGEQISQYDKIALTEIAKHHLNIPVYQMQTKVSGNKCKLITKKIDYINKRYI